jgi:hypothetical protein
LPFKDLKQSSNTVQVIHADALLVYSIYMVGFAHASNLVVFYVPYYMQRQLFRTNHVGPY